MDKDSNSLINTLVDDLAPVRSLRRSDGGALVCAAAVLTAIIVVVLGGIAGRMLGPRLLRW